MGVAKPDTLHTLYANIRKESTASNAAVLILATPDVDSLCACKILTTLFKADCIPHKVIPVAGYMDLGAANSNHVENHEELRSIVMLNCGGLVDVNEFFTLSDSTMVYLVDSHRPINLSNLFSSPRIVVVKEQESDAEAAELQELQHAYTVVEYDDDDDEDEDDDDDHDPEQPPDQEEDDADEDQDDDAENPNPDRANNKKRKTEWDINAVSAKRAKSADAKRNKRRSHRLINDYYSAGTYCGTSVADIIYTLADQLNRANTQLLWLGILGLTDQYLHDRIESKPYRRKVETWNQQVARFADPERDDIDPLLGERNSHSVRGADDTGIRAEDELRLMLFRHWSLNESMFHTSYIASRLGIWREKGRTKLTTLLVKMGMPQKECNQLFSEMKVSLKRSLKDKLVAVAPSFKIPDIQFPSFFKQYGYRTAISASDAVYSLSALLDAGFESVRDYALLGQFEQGSRPGGVTLAGVGVGMRIGAAAVGMRVSESIHYVAGETEADETERDSESERVRNFFVAYDALESVDLMYHGIQLAMHFQRALVRTGLSVLEKRMIKTLKAYRMVILNDSQGRALSAGTNGSGSNNAPAAGGMAGDRDYMRLSSSPVHLTRLASFLSEACKLEGKKKDLPFVIASPTGNSKRLVIGLAPPLESGDDVRKNPFGLAFQNTAAQARATINIDLFEASSVEVEEDDLASFMEILQRYA
ncbi:hypothetical protein SmJEL517_g03210 [Synchytrium microbalum]|uniref:CDC45-like protein n=1 Tax=Synchytrium microbalum TaxID=1806994 RepID=A0A507C973_9FUNG|nr:uncharacterized protein SmJEL517_g03210 [Synchytrium microbalum]TPX34055.1 hypothetical protein SmJEL517_g03210 [Synchytrium microbalum]